MNVRPKLMINFMKKFTGLVGQGVWYTLIIYTFKHYHVFKLKLLSSDLAYKKKTEKHLSVFAYSNNCKGIIYP